MMPISTPSTSHPGVPTSRSPSPVSRPTMPDSSSCPRRKPAVSRAHFTRRKHHRPAVLHWGQQRQVCADAPPIPQQIKGQKGRERDRAHGGCRTAKGIRGTGKHLCRRLLELMQGFLAYGC